MALPPFTFLEKKWSAHASQNTLIQAATQNTDRQQISLQDRDIHRNITPLGRRTLMSLGRYLFQNVGQVRGTVLDKANFASIGVISQYYGANQKFKDLAEAWIIEHNKICDVRGKPFTMDILRRNHAIALERDGGMYIALCENKDGYPLLQVIPAHRIGSPTGYTVVQEGDFDGARIIDGIIVDSSTRMIGARVLLNDDGYVLGPYIDVSASNIIASFIPDYPEQLREISPIGLAAFDFMDVNESRAFEKAALKLGSHYGMVVKNESGFVDKAKTVIRGAETAAESSGAANSLSTQVVNGVGVYYVKAGTGQGLDPIKNDRPSANQQNFEAEVIRSAIHGFGWSVDFSLDPSKVGGAPMRVVVEKINKAIGTTQALALCPVEERIDAWRIRKAIKLGLLPDDVDWWKWEHQLPAKITADKKYDSDVDIQEMRAALQAPQDAIGRRGNYWEDVQDKTIAFHIRGVKKTKEQAAAAGVEVEWKDIQWDSPNRPQQEKPESEEPDAEKEEETK
jgi:hypothetical protein